MGIEHLGKRTPEELRVMAEKGKAARAAKVAKWESEKHLLKLEYLDSGHWQTLASKHGVRMPSMIEPCSEKRIRKFLRKADVSNAEWVDHYGTVKDWSGYNSTWSLYAVTGLILEIRNEKGSG